MEYTEYCIYWNIGYIGYLNTKEYNTKYKQIDPEGAQNEEENKQRKKKNEKKGGERGRRGWWYVVLI